VGWHRALHVREERISARDEACRLLYISDIHLRAGRSSRLSHQIMDAARGCYPDVIVLGGDLADGRSELGRLCDLVRALSDIAGVFAIAGNHDCWIGVHHVREAVERGGGRWIHDDIALVPHRGRVIGLCGPDTVAPGDAHVRVLCAHNPRIWRTSRRGEYDLILAGHLHGCQLVAWEHRERLYPGAFVYPCCFLNADCGSTRLVVSRGVSDLVPIRWKCPREVVLCHV
jgi:predicted MPP superfamily phosphohydrolase